jgi:hypothetical protein
MVMVEGLRRLLRSWRISGVPKDKDLKWSVAAVGGGF